MYLQTAPQFLGHRTTSTTNALLRPNKSKKTHRARKRKETVKKKKASKIRNFDIYRTNIETGSDRDNRTTSTQRTKKKTSIHAKMGS